MLLRSSFIPLGLLVAFCAFAAETRPETIGTLDFFGLRRVTEAEVRAALKFKEGDPFPRSRARELAAELEKLPGVRYATVTGITVGGGELRVFVGIQEVGQPGFSFRDAPQGEQRLPEPLAQIYRDFGAALGPAVRKGDAGEDHSQGHALNNNPAMRAAEDAALVQMKEQGDVVRDVLHGSRHARDRGAAAWLLGYAPDKRAIVADLVAAARDPDPTVRNNATRALGIIAEFATAHPTLGIVIPSDLFIDMIRSVTWTDRNKGSFLLDGLTTNRPPELLRALREQALPELIEMARWKSKGHELPAVRVLGWIVGWPDPEIMRVWTEPNGLDKIIAAAQETRVPERVITGK